MFTVKGPLYQSDQIRKKGLQFRYSIVCTGFVDQSLTCNLFHGRTHRKIQKQVAHSKINDENLSLYVTTGGSNGGSYFCAKSIDDLTQAYPTMMPLLQRLQTTSEKATLKSVIDLDGIIVRISGTIDPRTISKAMVKNGISLDFKSNDRYDHVSIIFHNQFFFKDEYLSFYIVNAMICLSLISLSSL